VFDKNYRKQALYVVKFFRMKNELNNDKKIKNFKTYRSERRSKPCSNTCPWTTKTVDENEMILGASWSFLYSYEW